MSHRSSLEDETLFVSSLRSLASSVTTLDGSTWLLLLCLLRLASQWSAASSHARSRRAV